MEATKSKTKKTRVASDSVAKPAPAAVQLVQQPKKRVRVSLATTTSAAPAAKPSSLQQHKKSIDDLFSKVLREKKDKAEEYTVKQEEERAAAKLEAKKKAAHEMEERSYADPKVHRFDQESGLPVYKYFDLGMAIQGSGFTADCPFDCNCCH